jgi:hypothetical protein
MLRENCASGLPRNVPMEAKNQASNYTHNDYASTNNAGIRCCNIVRVCCRHVRNDHSLKMRRIDIFVSSPADVQKERSLVERLIRSTAAEYNVPVTVAYSNRLRQLKPSDRIAAGTANGYDDGRSLLCSCFWEYQDFRREQEYQERIPNTGQYDLVICILWSRLGPKISPAFVMPNGSQPTSASEYEIAWVLDQVNRTPEFPELRVYRNLATPVAALEPKEARETSFQQWDSVQEFFSTWKSKSAFCEACSEYQDLREFENLFRKHFRDFVIKQLDREIVPRKPAPNAHCGKLNPFRGLQCFNFEDAAVFHGRTKAIGEVLDALMKQANTSRPFVLILGPSGSGKSSLVRAGVLPFLTEVGSSNGPWRRAMARPGAGGTEEDPFNRLAAALLREAALPELQDAGAPNGQEDLASELRKNPEGVAHRIIELLDQASLQEMDRVADEERSEFELLRSIEGAELARHRRLTRIKPEAHLALIIDPLEELFTGGFSPGVQHRYIAALVTLIHSERVVVIATLQSDFYAAYQEFPELTELVGSTGRYDLQAPTLDEMADMIRLPAEAAGLRFEQDLTTGCGLDQTILDAAVSSAEPLPLLEHLLSELYQKQAARQDGLLRCSDYKDLGGFEGSLANHAESIFTTLESDAQAAFDFVMRRLISFGNRDQGIRRTVLYRDIVSPAELDTRQKEGAKILADSLIKEGLLYAEPELTQERIVCISHQALLRRWPRVRQWLAEDRAFLRIRDRLDASLNLWVRRGRQSQDLLGPWFGITDAKTLLSYFRSSLSKTQIDYIERILATQKQDRPVRNSIWFAVGAGFAVLTAIAGIQWYNTESQKKGEEELARIERRITEIAKKNGSGQESDLKRINDNSQTEQANRELPSDEENALEAESSQAQDKPRFVEPSGDLFTDRHAALGSQLKRAQNQQAAQNQKGRTNPPDAKDGAEPILTLNNGLISSDQDQSKMVQNEKNQTGDGQSYPASANSSDPEPLDPPAAETANDASEEQQLKAFVIDYLQTIASDDVSTQKRFFAQRVAYFDRGVIPLRRIQAAKESYDRAWPNRDWKPQGEAEIHGPNGRNLYEIVQSYTWTASDGSQHDQGSGTLFMRVYKTAKGKFHIVHIERRN